jgi:hypothetical protein
LDLIVAVVLLGLYGLFLLYSLSSTLANQAAWQSA